MSDKAKKLPLIAVANLCEKVLREEDGVLSLIRLIDRVALKLEQHERNQPPPPLKFDFHAMLVLSVRSGGFRGPVSITVVATAPDGSAFPNWPESKLAADFASDDQAAALLIQLRLQLTQTGTYWFTVSALGEVLTRIPLHVEPPA